MRWKVWVLTTLLVGCDSGSSDGGDTDATSTSSSTTSGDESSSSGGSTGGSSSTSSATTGDPFPGTTTMPPTTDSNGEEGESSTGEPLPEGPSCSVQVTTHGLLTDPLPRGDTAFPPVVADALEDWCGCHTLESNNQNVEHTGLLAPGGTLFMTFEDISRPSGGGTLGDAFATAVAEYSMPPGSCSFPSDGQTILEAWFEQGFPDGANFVPPE